MLKRNIPLSNLSNIKIGGPAAYFSEFSSKEDLIEILSDWREINPEMDKIIVLGDGTNILFNDKGHDGLVLKNSIDFIDRSDNLIEVGSGTKFSKLLDFCVENSLSGLEWAGGLPGTVGGAVRGNAGAYGGETKDNVLSVISLDIKTLQEKTRLNPQCKFGYRDSIFKSGGIYEIILSAKIGLKRGGADEIIKSIDERKNHRQEKHPLDLPNLGSTFKNIPLDFISEDLKEKYKNSIKKDPFPIFPSTKLLAVVGLGGKTIGGAKFSEKHPNFIVNFNNAKSSDVRCLIDFAKAEVLSKFGVKLEEEILVL